MRSPRNRNFCCVLTLAHPGLLRYEQATFSAILALGPVAGWYLDLPALAFDATSPFPGSAPFHTVSSFLAPHPRSQVHEDSVSATSRGLFIFVKGMFEALADAGISVPSPSLAWDTFREAYGKAGLLNGGELFQVRPFASSSFLPR